MRPWLSSHWPQAWQPRSPSWPLYTVHGTPRDHPPSAWIHRGHLVGQVLGLYACVWNVTAATGLATSGRFNLSRPVSSLKTRAVAGLAAGL